MTEGNSNVKTDEPREPNNFQDVRSPEDRFRERLYLIVICLIGTVSVAAFGLIVFRGLTKEAWLPVTQAHFGAIVGLPMAALAALFVVIALRSSEGQVEMEGLGFKFKGASGPVILWIFCFLAISSAIKLVW